MLYENKNIVRVDRFVLCWLLFGNDSGNDCYSLSAGTKKLSRWLSHAGSIVSSDRSFARDRFRGSIQFAVATTGRALTDEQFQTVLDDLAQSTAVNILDAGAIPDLDEFVEAEINAVDQGFGLKRWNWPGALYDQLPYPLGWGHDYVQIPGDTLMEYLGNMSVALMQNVIGFNRYLNRDTPLDAVPSWKMSRDVNGWINDNLYRLFSVSPDEVVDVVP